MAADEKKSRNSLPKTPDAITNGGVYAQSVRCGKADCQCACGSPHFGYYYFIHRVAGRLRKIYVPKDEVENLVQLVEQSRQYRSIERDTLMKSLSKNSEFQSHLRTTNIKR